MFSQALLELNELFPAVEAAEEAVHLEPTWPVAWQTLGRAQIGLGEIEMVCGKEVQLKLPHLGGLDVEGYL